MRAFLLNVSLGVVFTLPCSASLPVARPLASVRFVVHRLTVAPPHRSSANARVGDSLFPAYGLQTGAGARASIRFVNKSTLHMNQRTNLVLRSPQRTLLQRGEIAILDGPGRHLQVQTGTALATAIGTRFDVRIAPPPSPPGYGASTSQSLPAGTTTVSVVAGLVDVSNSRGKVRVKAGEWTHVRPGKAPTAPTRHNAGKDVAWAAGLP